MTFDEIAKTTQISFDEVEMLLMKSMSLGLIQGIIDQVDSTLRVTWIKPRMLSKEKVQIMTDKLNRWSEECTQLLHGLEE